MKHKILILSEFSPLSTGYATYCRELLLGLKDHFEVAELASYADPNSPDTYSQPWKVYPILPNKKIQSEVDTYNSTQLNVFGLWKFDHVCLDFRPTQVITVRDYWFDYWLDHSPFRSKFYWSWLLTADAARMHEEWLDVYSRVDGCFAYNDWSLQQLREESNNRLNLIGTAPPNVSGHLYPEENVKNYFGLQDYMIFGTVMRNQKRKLFDDLFHSFRLFLNQTDKKVLLYCHTSYPDNNGWDIPKLLQQYGISSKVLFSYVCRHCQQYFPSFFNDSVCACPKCGQISAGLTNTKHGLNLDQMRTVYNLMDLYIQMANAEGFGIGQIEAASCSVPVIATDYSAMSDVVRKLNGWPLKVLKLNPEIETGRLMAIPDNDDLIRLMLNFANMPKPLRKIAGQKSYQGFKDNYGWDQTIKIWIDHINSIDHSKYEKLWKSPKRIKKLPNKVPDGLSNRDYIRWLITDVLQDEAKLDSYFELKMLRQLNHGVSTANYQNTFMEDSTNERSKMKNFSREDAYNYILHLVKTYNHFEGMR